MARALPLFGDLPDGFQYREEFISVAEERSVLDRIQAAVEFAAFEMRGVVARRRVAFFGLAYSEGAVAAPMPDFLLPLRARLGAWADVPADAFAMALINEYRPGAPIGWHRDAAVRHRRRRLPGGRVPDEIATVRGTSGARAVHGPAPAPGDA